MGKDKISANPGTVKFFLEKDTIYHPGLSFTYQVEKRLITILRGDDGLQKTPFSNSFHKYDMLFEQITTSTTAELRNMMIQELATYFPNIIIEKLDVTPIEDLNTLQIFFRYSVALTNNKQEADTGTKMIHIGKNTRSTIISKGISAGYSNNSYRGLVQIRKGASNARNFSQCDSLLMGDKCGAHTFPYIEIKDKTAIVEHEATTSKIGEDQLFYCKQRGIDNEKAIGLIVNGYCKEVLNKLPMEFAVEAQKLLAVSLEGSVG
jgi:hypothetical protein